MERNQATPEEVLANEIAVKVDAVLEDANNIQLIQNVT